MPFYEYQCSACGAQTEVLQKITDAPLKKCPECGKNKLSKLVSAPVFRLKGGGWYETDFKSDKDTKRNLVDDGGKEPAAEKPDKPAEMDKPADKTDKAESKPAPRAEPAAGGTARKASRPVAKPVAKAATRKPAAKPARSKAKR